MLRDFGNLMDLNDYFIAVDYAWYQLTEDRKYRFMNYIKSSVYWRDLPFTKQLTPSMREEFYWNIENTAALTIYLKKRYQCSYDDALTLAMSMITLL